jgi:hypothetical protein
MSEERMTVRGKQVLYIHEEDYRAPVDRAAQSPDFSDEADEAAWWNEHRLSEEFWRNAEPLPADESLPVREPHRTVAQEQEQEQDFSTATLARSLGANARCRRGYAQDRAGKESRIDKAGGHAEEAASAS